MPREDGIVTDSKQYRIYSTDAKAVTQCGQGGGLGAKTGLYALRVGAMPNETGELKDNQSRRIYSIGNKARTLMANANGGGNTDVSAPTTGLYALPVDEPKYYAMPCEWVENRNPTKAVSCADGKTYTVYRVENGEITIKDKQYPIKLVDGYYIIRKLTVRECMRLQTVPEWYEFPVSNTRAFQLLGNGWTCDVITHLIKSCVETKR